MGRNGFFAILQECRTRQNRFNMKLTEEERKIIVGLEIEKSKRTFAEIEILRQAGLWNTIANRLFYAFFMLLPHC